jgi:hypothetical protein
MLLLVINAYRIWRLSSRILPIVIYLVLFSKRDNVHFWVNSRENSPMLEK